VPSPTVQPGLSQPAEVRGSHAQVRVPEGRHVGVGCPTWLPRCRWAEELPLREVRYGLPEDAAGGGGQQVRAAVVVAEGLTRCTSLRRLGCARTCPPGSAVTSSTSQGPPGLRAAGHDEHVPPGVRGRRRPAQRRQNVGQGLIQRGQKVPGGHHT
jgi:hypothetical protein